MIGKVSSNIVLVGAVLLLLVVIGYRYEQYVLEQNFTIKVNTSCDPAERSCFISGCIPEEDLSCPVGPYMKVEILKRDAPACLEEHQCQDFVCGDIASCTITYCSDETIEEDEECINRPQTSII